MTPDAQGLLLVLGAGGAFSFVGSVPMTGPLALLIIDRMLAGERRAALWIALAGALVEGAIAAAVATLLPLVLRHSELIIQRARLGGAVVIFSVGLTLALRPDVLESIKTERKRQSFAAGFLTTALNPTLLATWTVAVTALHDTGLGLGLPGAGPTFGLGVALGSLGWFVLLLAIARRAQLARLTRHRATFGRSIGVLLAALGAALFARVVWSA